MTNYTALEKTSLQWRYALTMFQSSVTSSAYYPLYHPSPLYAMFQSSVTSSAYYPHHR